MSFMYDFDKVIDRRDTNSFKYDALDEMYGRNDLISLWVADMDFATPDFVVEALRERLDHPVFGYTKPYDSYWQSIVDWTYRRHAWAVEREWLCYIPGIVKGIAMALHAFTQKGDKVIIQPPVYHPFRLVTENLGRVCVENPLRCDDGVHYRMDFEQLESVIDEQCKVIILANPHNPIGIVWSREDLQRLAHIAAKHNLIVLSDEIHCDMALYGNRHAPFAAVSDEARRCSVTFAAPSKTFNIAGIVSSYAIVPDAHLREQFFSWAEAAELSAPTLFAMVATEAAFTQGDEWREQMLRYVEQNIDFVADYMAQHHPEIRVIKPQASFLVWIDFSALGLQHDALVDFMVNRAHLAMNDGAMFGRQGEQFMRMNVGLPRAVLHKALQQLTEAISTL